MYCKNKISMIVHKSDVVKRKLVLKFITSNVLTAAHAKVPRELKEKAQLRIKSTKSFIKRLNFHV